MFPLSIQGFVKAYAGIRARITNSVAHLLFESSVLKTKVACGHVQWNDNSVKLETRFRGGSLQLRRDAFMCQLWCYIIIQDVKSKSMGKHMDVPFDQQN